LPAHCCPKTRDVSLDCGFLPSISTLVIFPGFIESTGERGTVRVLPAYLTHPQKQVRKNTPLPPPVPNFPIKFQNRNTIFGMREKFPKKQWKSFGSTCSVRADDAPSSANEGGCGMDAAPPHKSARGKGDRVNGSAQDLLHQLWVFFIILCRGDLDPTFLGTRAA